MMSLESIIALSDEQAAKAARLNKHPYIVEQDEIARWQTWLQLQDDAPPTFCKRIPNIGSYRPKGWKLGGYWTVAKYGVDGDGGSALSVRSLINHKLVAGKGYAIIEEGQFQIVIGEFTPPATLQVKVEKVSEGVTCIEIGFGAPAKTGSKVKGKIGKPRKVN
jgi:hypothetical protein